MKKILTSLIITIVIISSCGLVFADNNGEQPKVTLNMTEEFTTSTEATTVTIKLGYGIVEGLEENALVSFKGKLKYDTSIFSEVKVEGINGYTATYAPETQRIVLDPKEATASTEIANITFTLADGVEPCSTDVNFEIEEFTDGTNDFEYTNKVATIKIEKSQSDESENNTEQTNSDSENVNNNTSSTQNPNTEQTTSSTEETVDKDEIPGKENQNLSNEQQKNTDPTVAQESIPKTGTLSVKIIIAIFIIIGIISVIRFKNIEIK